MTIAALLLIFPVLMAYAAVSDLLTMTIPNRLSLLLIAAFVGMALLGQLSLQDVASHLAAAGAVLVCGFALFAFGWMGGGDAKLAASTALWFGFESLPDYLIYASLGGGALTLAILALRHLPLPRIMTGWAWLLRLHDPKTGIPYGIALAASGLIVYPQSQVWSALLAQ